MKLRIALCTAAFCVASGFTHAQDGWEKLSNDIAWAPRFGEAIVQHGGKLWAFGGSRHERQMCLDDVWSSADGVQWEQVLEHAPWGPRVGLAAASFQGKLWVSGGGDCDRTYHGDLWSSEDGVSWTRMPEPPWMGRGGHALIEFQDKLWVLSGGMGEYTPYGDVWYTADGATWTLAAPVAPWGKRLEFAAVVHNSRLWIMGGRGLNGVQLDDVWSTADGKIWQQDAVNAGWLPRVGLAGASLGGKLWIFGGSEDRNSTHYNDVWNSVDGATWTQVTEAAPWPKDFGFKAIHFRDKLWLLGGNDRYFPGMFVWTTADGVQWEDALGARWIPRKFQSAAEYDGYIWVIGGTVSKGLADVWKSRDGSAWERVTDDAPWKRKLGAVAVSFAGKLWLIGGGLERTPDAQLWWTTDGANWTQAPPPPWPMRWHHTVTVWKDKLWLVGGESESPHDDVWHSEDGLTWTEAKGGPGGTAKGLRQVGPRHRHGAAVLDGKLWLVGGFNANYENTSDVWSTENGTDWTKIDAPSPFTKLNAHQLVAHDDRLWLLGGAGFEGADGTANPIVKTWTTANGRDWSVYGDTNPWSARQWHSAVVHNDRVYVLGGTSNFTGRMNDVWATTPNGEFEAVTATAPVKPDVVDAQVTASGTGSLLRVWPSPLWKETLPLDRIPPDLGATPIVFNGRFGLYAGATFWWTSDGRAWERRPIQLKPLPEEPWMWANLDSPIVHDGYLWLVSNGGYGTGGVWRSKDGVTFEAVTQRSPWETFNAWFVSFAGHLWLIGGQKHSQFSNVPDEVSEIWKSADGKVWELVNATPPWNGRWGYQQFVFGDRIWIVGGRDRNGRSYNDAWVSADGKTWTQQVLDTSPTWPKPSDYRMVAIGNALWMLDRSSGTSTKLHRSRDGVAWETLGPAVEIDPSYAYSGVDFADTLWIVAGPVRRDLRMESRGSAQGTALWSVSLKYAWRKHVFGDAWSAHAEGALTFNDRIWVFSKREAIGEPTRTEAWTSEDGAVWTRAVEALPWGPRDGAAFAVHDGRAWAMAGAAREGGSEEYHNDVWSSPDGVMWTQATAAAPWKARMDARAVSFKGKLFLFGGRGLITGDPATHLELDAWTTSNGVNWSPLGAPLPAGNVPIVFDDKLWILGAGDPNRRPEDADAELHGAVLVSDDAVTWTRVDVDKSWTPRVAPNALVQGARMWAFWGYHPAAAEMRSDVPMDPSVATVQWSTDGRHWTTVDALTQEVGLLAGTLLTHREKIWWVDAYQRKVAYLDETP